MKRNDFSQEKKARTFVLHFKFDAYFERKKGREDQEVQGNFFAHFSIKIINIPKFCLEFRFNKIVTIVLCPENTQKETNKRPKEMRSIEMLNCIFWQQRAYFSLKTIDC